MKTTLKILVGILLQIVLSGHSPNSILKTRVSYGTPAPVGTSRNWCKCSPPQAEALVPPLKSRQDGILPQIVLFGHSPNNILKTRVSCGTPAPVSTS